MQEIFELIIKFASVPVFITAIYAMSVYKKLPAELQIISWFIFLSAVIQGVSEFLWFQSQNNLWLLHIYVGVGFVLLAAFYNSILSGFINKAVIRLTTILFVIFTIINAAYFQGFYSYASYSITIESILIIILSLSTFIMLLDNIVKESKAHLVKSINWINSGLFIYYTSSLLLFYFGELLTLDSLKNPSQFAWVLHFVFLVIMNICFIVGIWKRPKN